MGCAVMSSLSNAWAAAQGEGGRCGIARLISTCTRAQGRVKGGSTDELHQGWRGFFFFFFNNDNNLAKVDRNSPRRHRIRPLRMDLAPLRGDNGRPWKGSETYG